MLLTQRRIKDITTKQYKGVRTLHLTPPDISNKLCCPSHGLLLLCLNIVHIIEVQDCQFSASHSCNGSMPQWSFVSNNYKSRQSTGQCLNRLFEVRQTCRTRRQKIVRSEVFVLVPYKCEEVGPAKFTHGPAHWNFCSNILCLNEVQRKSNLARRSAINLH